MVYFRQDGSPILDMTDAEWLATANRTVTAKVTVSAPALDVTGAVTARCVAGKVVQVVSVTNGEDAPVAVSVSGPYGTKAFASIAAGKTASASFTTRLGAIPSGSVAVTGTATGGGIATMTQEISYSPASCG
jgi:hypothetical protein